MIRANFVSPRGAWQVKPADTIVLDFDERHRRRIAMTGTHGLEFLLDLPDAVMLRGGDVFQQRPRDVMRHFLFVEPPEGHILFQPQSSLLVDDDGQTLLADKVGRVEDMQGSYDAICARIGIAARPLDRVNGSEHGDYRRYYDQTLIDGVAARYARDLDLFDYSFDGPK